LYEHVSIANIVTIKLATCPHEPYTTLFRSILANTEILAIDIIKIFIDSVKMGIIDSSVPPPKNIDTMNIVNNSVMIPIPSNVSINGLTLEIIARSVVYKIMVIKIVLLKVNQGNILTARYQKINTLGSIFAR